MIHLMIDLETLSLKPNALVLQIGAVLFDKDHVYAKFECYLNQLEQKRRNWAFHVDESTVKWWEGQSQEAKKVLEMSRRSDVTPEKAKEAFKLFLEPHVWSKDELIVWSNGADFDLPIMKNLFNDQVPWKFTNQRCYRTEKRLFKHLPFGREGELHNAVFDALHQAQNLQQHFKLFPDNNK